MPNFIETIMGWQTFTTDFRKCVLNSGNWLWTEQTQAKRNNKDRCRDQETWKWQGRKWLSQESVRLVKYEDPSSSLWPQHRSLVWWHSLLSSTGEVRAHSSLGLAASQPGLTELLSPTIKRWNVIEVILWPPHTWTHTCTHAHPPTWTHTQRH